MLLVVYPVTHLWLGLSVRHRERLAIRGPAIIVANHNSHLDTLALLALVPLRLVWKVRPVAAADYFLRSRCLAWFSQKVIGIIPVDRAGREEGCDPLAECHSALDRGEILLIFPEGTRGEPERMTAFRSGVARLAERHANTPVMTVFMHGLGKSLPKGTFVPVPLYIDVLLGVPFSWTGSHESFMAKLQEVFDRLRAELHTPEYT